MNHQDFVDDLKAHYNDAVRYCRALCAPWSPSEAQDVFQSAVLRAMSGYPSLADRARFRSWFFQILTRTFYSHVRASFWKRFVPLQEDESLDPMPAVYAEDVPHAERQVLFEALSTLSKKQRTALLLFELGGFSIEEIARIQQARSLSAVKSRLSRARRSLRDALTTIEETRGWSPALRGTFHGDLDHETISLVAEAQKIL